MERREFLRSAMWSAAAVSAVSPWRRMAMAQQSLDDVEVHPEVKRVVMVFKCHLDVGFTDTQANVMQKYFK